jgi:LacI family transcriptional regulator
VARERPDGTSTGRGATTIRDVARHAGVSTATVSRVLNGKVTVEPALAERVHAACAALQYQPSHAARSLASGRSGLVGLLVADIRIPFFMEAVCGAEAILRRHGYLPILCNFQEDPAGAREYRRFIELLVAVPLAGALVVPRHDRGAALRLFREHAIPTVTIDHRSADGVSDSVVIDNVAAAREAVTHLIANGYRRIGLIAGPETAMTGRDRALGYRLALQDAGIVHDPSLEYHDVYNEKTGYRYTQTLLECQPPIDALFTANYTITVGALRALYERGLRVPEDLGLAGFDEVPSLFPGGPSITCIAQPAYDLGAAAARRLIQRLEERGPHLRQEIVLPYQLQIGASSRPRGDGDQALAV